MPKNYDARNTSENGGQISGTAKPCPECGGSGTVRVSKARKTAHNSPAHQTYDIVTEPCGSCRK